MYQVGDLFFAVVEKFDRYSLEHYDFIRIVEILSEFNLDKDFINIPIFDALIASEDRHCDNWGIIANNEGYKMAPIYDNGSSMGFQLLEERVEKMFLDENMFKAFCNRSYSLIGLPNKRKPRYLELLSLIHNYYPKEVEKAFEAIDALDGTSIEKILAPIPVEVMSLTYKKWVKKLLLYRKKRLINWYERGAI